MNNNKKMSQRMIQIKKIKLKRMIREKMKVQIKMKMKK